MVVEAATACRLSAGSRILQIIDVEVHVHEGGVFGPCWGSVVRDAHELQFAPWQRTVAHSDSWTKVTCPPVRSA